MYNNIEVEELKLTEKQMRDFVEKISKELNDIVFRGINEAIQNNPTIRKNLNPAFPYPREVRVGILNNCLAVEYVGPEILDEDRFQIAGVYQPYQSPLEFLNIDLSHLKTLSLAVNENVENMSFFLGDSISYLCDYFYDITQMPSELIQVNGYLNFEAPSKPIYISNTTFFWTDRDGALKIRHIDFLEIFPSINGDIVYHDEKSLEHFMNFLIGHRVPGYKIELHKKLNEFIELINLPNINEPAITKFLEVNPEILQISFGANRLNSQVKFEWQYQTEKPDLKPDFLIERMDGFCDILEFKLPKLKSEPIVGSTVREHPSFEIDSAIAQIDQYDEWCSQEINRQWLEKNKNIKILCPIKYLIIGHSKKFNPQDRQKIRSTRNIVVFTYDEFIEMARYQIYRVR